MKALLHKEYLVNRQGILITILILILGGFVMADSFQIPLFLPLLFGAIQPFSDAKNVDINKNEILINSLPTTRKKIVLSKYVFSIIVVLVYFSLVTGINRFLPLFEPNTMIQILLSFAGSVLFLSFYYPMFYLLGPRFLTAGMSVVGFLALAVAFPVINMGARNNYWGIEAYINSFSMIQFTGALIIILVTITISSYFLSSSLYKRKDF